MNKATLIKWGISALVFGAFYFAFRNLENRVKLAAKLAGSV